jgi:hypothetical protein
MWNTFVIWFFQLGQKLAWILVLSFMVTTFAIYLHFTHENTDKALNFVQYTWGMVYRCGIFILFIFFADACRFLFQSED